MIYNDFYAKMLTPIIHTSTDIHCEIQAVPFAQLSQMQPGEPSATIRERVIRAHKIQEERFKEYKGIHCNAMMTERMIHEFAEPDAQPTSPAQRKCSPCTSPKL